MERLTLDRSSPIGSLPLASVTSLRAYRQTVIAAGLCGRLRAWHLGDDGCWTLCLDVQNRVAMARGRSSSYAYQHVTDVVDGQFSAATGQPGGRVEVYSAESWEMTQQLTPAGEEHERERWSLSCLEASPRYLACGSREGTVALWHSAGAGSEYTRCWSGPGESADRGGAHGEWPSMASSDARCSADEGPIGALAIDERAGLLIGAYRQAGGSVDGAAFHGEQSAAAWSLASGERVWRAPQPPSADGPRPTLGVFLGAGSGGSSPWLRSSVWLLQGHAAHVDAGWPWLLPSFLASTAEVAEGAAEGATDGAEEGAAAVAAAADVGPGARMRSLPIAEAHEAGPPPGRSEWMVGDSR